MLGKTSISAIRALLLLAEQDAVVCWSPRRIAEELVESPTYLAKVVRHMVRSGILEAEKGVKGGVRLVRKPEHVTLLAIVEACQGTIAGDYCKPSSTRSTSCNFHRAAVELHEAITGVLGRWRLADLLVRPAEPAQVSDGAVCLMAGGVRQLEAGK